MALPAIAQRRLLLQRLAEREAVFIEVVDILILISGPPDHWEKSANLQKLITGQTNPIHLC
jgi:hypothetical protein